MDHSHPISSAHNSYALREGVSYCEIDGSYIFLDARSDRYFMLTGAAVGAFRSFSAAEHLSQSTADLLKQSGIVEDSRTWSCRPEPAIPQPLQQAEAALTGRFRVSQTLRAMHAVRRARCELLSNGIHRVFQRLTKSGLISKAEDQGKSERLAQTLRAFEHTRLWIPSADQCLPRTVALVTELTKFGHRANLVIGVRIAPFRAHCWAQSAGDVLNDSAEEVGKFKPILVL